MRQANITILIYPAVPLAAFLTFILQPVVGKMLMPRHGGDIGTWMTCMFFFQTALLAGYGLAAYLRHAPGRVQTWTVALLAVAAPASLQLPPLAVGEPGQAWGIFLGLSVSLLPTLLLTTGIGILAQGWIQDLGRPVPYHLYSVSNLGSLAALIVYPFFIEPHVGLAAQALCLRAGAMALAAATLGMVWLKRGAAAAAAAPEGQAAAPAPEHTPPVRTVSWILLSFLSCTAMMGGIQLLGAELGSNPLAWIIPLGLYLLTFSAAFAGFTPAPVLTLAVGALAVNLFILSQGTAKGHGASLLLWVGAAVGLASLLANGLLYQLRPARNFTPYYLWISVGGALSGFFCSVAAPVLFDRHLELYLTLIVLVLAGAVHLVAAPLLTARLAVAALALLPSGIVYWHAYRDRGQLEGNYVHLRNAYSTLILLRQGPWVYCTSETTLHGLQSVQQPLRGTPTSYYSEGGGLGLVVRQMQQEQPALRLGTIGLGAGTMAAYVRPADSITFWEINPLMRTIAEEGFYYLMDCQGKASVEMKDGRCGVRESPATFDLLVLDAFSGDAVPTHLLTREAFADYLARAPNGIIAAHISSRYAKLWPVLARHARALGLRARYVAAATTPKTAEANVYQRSCVYVMLARPAAFAVVERALAADRLAATGWDYTLEDADRVQEGPDWTDDRHAIIDVLSPTAFLGKP